MPYDGDVTPGGPTAVRELDEVVIRKASVGTMDNNAYLLTCRASGAQLLVDAADDPRFVGTVRAIREELEVGDGLVHRYHTQATDDGLAGSEHPFLACSFWLADAVARMGDTDESGRLLERLIGLSNDLGLLAEEYDVQNQRMMGNVPQALSHLALVRAVYSHDEAVRRSLEGEQTAEDTEDTRALRR